MAGGQIGGSLNFGQMAGNANFFSGDIATNYANAYKSALSLNQQNYNNILKGYQKTAAFQQQQQQAVVAGYGALKSEVLGKLEGTYKSGLSKVNDYYTAQQGQATQSLVNRGLGNSTITSSVARGLSADRTKAGLDVAEKYANSYANYGTQIGLAGLNYQGNAVKDNTSLSMDQLHWMNTVQAPYPEAKDYMALAKMRADAAPPQYPNYGGYGGSPSRGGGGYPPYFPPQQPPQPPPINACFVAGTLIATPKGQVPIESLQVGDEVLAFDHGLVPSTVTATHVAEAATLELTLSDGSVIVTTDEHPFRHRGEWVKAADLKPGAELVSLTPRGDGFGLKSAKRGEVRTVYNISVATQENYFAGGVLVHNKQPGPGAVDQRINVPGGGGAGMVGALVSPPGSRDNNGSSYGDFDPYAAQFPVGYLGDARGVAGMVGNAVSPYGALADAMYNYGDW
jgi:hypothetical protein